MNYTNFERHYVKDYTLGSDRHISLWKHNNGVVCDIDYYWDDNQVYMQFEGGFTLTVDFGIGKNEGTVKVGLHDDFRTRDFTTHPNWAFPDSRIKLVKLWLRFILSNKATPEQLEAVRDFVEHTLILWTE